jgi:hypothetical protein
MWENIKLFFIYFFEEKYASVVGWGTTYYGGKESPVQRKAEIPVWRNEDCNRAYFQPITQNFLCAGFSDGGVDACQVRLIVYKLWVITTSILYLLIVSKLRPAQFEILVYGKMFE